MRKLWSSFVLESMQRVLWYVQSYEKAVRTKGSWRNFGEKQKEKSLLKSAGSLIRQSCVFGEIDGVIQKAL